MLVSAWSIKGNAPTKRSTSAEPPKYHHDMDKPSHLHAGLGEPKSLRPNLYSSKSFTGVNSDPEKKSRPSKPKSHWHHEQHVDRHSSSRRHAVQEIVQSAVQVQPAASFQIGDLLKQARGSKEGSPGHSRKGSFVQLRDDGSLKGKESNEIGITIPPRKPLQTEDLEREAKRVKAAERDLRIALNSLSDQSIKIARRLDDTYYSILEKVSVLRQTIGTLQELSGLTRELHDNFEADTKELIEDAKGQLEGFDNLQAQQEQVTLLEERIKAGKEKADTLTSRLAQAKERVVARAKSEAEWEASHNRRVRIFWGTIASMAAAIFALILFQHFKPAHVVQGPQMQPNLASKAKIMDAAIPDIAKEAIVGFSRSTASKAMETSFARPLLTDDDRLRAFDQL